MKSVPSKISVPKAWRGLRETHGDGSAWEAYRAKERRYSVVSLFSGCGGMDLGFRGGFKFLGRKYEPLPFRVVWANDNNAAACDTYRLNLGAEIQQADVLQVLDKAPKKADVVIGGFPCQDISINGLMKGLDGKRSPLYRAMVDVVARCHPQVFVAENVKGLLLEHHQEFFEQVLLDFQKLGYDVTYRTYLAADYGVPQMRQRVFIVGTAPGVKPFVPPTPSTPEGSWITSQAAIGDLEGIAENGTANHVWSRAERSPEQGERQIKADRPSSTIRAEHHGNTQFHYSLNRRLSIREAARIQSFPDNFVFASRLRETERQVGNAVPPVLAWHIARSILKCLRTTPTTVASPERTRQLVLATP